MFKLYCRLYQKVLHVGKYVLPWREPKLFAGSGSLTKLPELLVKEGISNVLIVTDQNIRKLRLLDPVLDSLTDHHITFVIYDGTVPNPTADNVEKASSMFKANACEAIVAFGGGSSIDCAKGVGAKIARPKKRIRNMRGLLRIRKRIPLLIAIPTTAGTGSEATIAAVISDTQTHQKYLIIDLVLTPHYAIHDPLLTIELPPEITAATGMDALTHAIESYIGQSNTNKTKKQSVMATQLIFENLQVAYDTGDNVTARTNMLQASYYAGLAFTRSGVGYVHAIAHAIGGLYGVPHGLANAVILPYILHAYGETIHIQLAQLADMLNLGHAHASPSQKASTFIKRIEAMNQHLRLPQTIPEIQESDISIIVQQAYKEANPFYPVPKILTKAELATIVRNVVGL